MSWPSDAGVDLQRAVGELGVAGAEDDLGVDVDAELVLQRLADVDLGEDPEALFLEGVLHVGDDVVVGGVELDAAGEVHGWVSCQ
jgi:hypothetical protein